MQTLYKLTDQLSNLQWHYGSIAAMVEHFDNPLDADNVDVQNARRKNRRLKKPDYPIFLAGCRVDLIRVWNVNEVRKDNPPTLTEQEAARMGIEPHTD